MASLNADSHFLLPSSTIFLSNVSPCTFLRSLYFVNPIPVVDSILDKVDKNDITSPDAVVHQIGPLKDALQSFEMQVRQSLECLDHLLTHDDEMLALLLTEQNGSLCATNKQRKHGNHVLIATPAIEAGIRHVGFIWLS